MQLYEKPVATVFLFTPLQRLAHEDDERNRNAAGHADDDGFDAGTSLEDSVFG